MRILLRLWALAVVAMASDTAPASAASLIRDAEIEASLERIAHPIFRAAGLNPATVNIYIVSDPDLNAFVAGGQNLFINTGLLTRLDSIDQLRAVIAHETGHIAGGHLARRDQALRGAKGVAVLGMIGAAAATIGGSPGAGVAIATGTSQVAARSALAHTRAEEAAADQAGLRYLAAAGGDPAAFLEVLRLFRGQEALLSAGVDPYAVTHPLWSDRIALIEERVGQMPTPPASDPADAYWHARMVAKLDGFLESPARVLQRYPDDGSEPAALARAVAYHRRPAPDQAIAAADALIAMRPDDAFYHELEGQFLLEAGRAPAAVESYRRAVAFAPKQALILGGLGRALLNTDDPAATAEARDALARSAELDGANAGVLRDLALAEARLGNDGAASLATAERFVVEGEFADAFRNAERAAALLPEGSPGWRQAQDLITMTRRTRTRN